MVYKEKVEMLEKGTTENKEAIHVEYD